MSEHTGRHGSETADSAGVPWAGRELHENPFAGDDGSAAPEVSAALVRCAQAQQAGDRARRVAGLQELGAALLTHRVLIPAVAQENAGTADVGFVTIWGEDGRQAFPVFTSVAALTRWQQQARPVPQDTRRALLAAVAQECQTVRVDAGSPHAVTLPRPAVWAWAQGHAWVPFLADEAAQARVRAELQEIAGVGDVAFTSGERYEVRVAVRLPKGLNASQLREYGVQVTTRLAQSQTVADCIDSVTVAFG